MDVYIDQKLSKRIVVLISNCLANHNELAHSIHWMAERENLSVLYLVLVDNNENMLAASRNMATVKAVTSADRLLVEVKLVETGNWMEALRKFAVPSDVIVCHEEKSVQNGSYKTVPVSDFLASHTHCQIRAFSADSRSFQQQGKKRFHEFFALAGFLIILALFTWLHIQLDLSLDGNLQKIFIMGTFVIEMGTIWLWYQFAYR